VTNRELYEGFALQAVDAKGRVAIPADLRAAMERNSDSRTIVVRRNGPCLSAYDVERSKDEFGRIHNREIAAEEAAGLDGGVVPTRAKANAFGKVERTPFDPSGRFILPRFFKMKAGINNWAFFVGHGDTFEIWAPEILMTSSDDEELKEICAFCLDEKKVTL
jgi:MraZ protein